MQAPLQHSTRHCRAHGRTTPFRSVQPVQCIAKPAASVTGSDIQEAKHTQSRRQLLQGLCGLTVAGLVLPQRAHAEAGSATASAPFLQATGAKGILAEEELRLFKLRQEKEGEARARLLEEKAKLEEESRQTMTGKLCATPFGVDIVGITEFVALVGALVGGITARQRKDELERLNEQLRKINLSLRQQARAGTVYAPGLSYAPPVPEGSSPVSSSSSSPAPRMKVNPHTPKPSVATSAAAVAVAAPTTTTTTVDPASTTILSMEEEELSPEQMQCRDALRQGKRLLKERNGSAAMVRFEKALMLSKAFSDKVQERRAMRGLAASARLQGQYRSAIKHLERVLEISREMGEYTGDADAYGTIADCYTDMGDLEKAATFYDKYIETMNRDGPV